MSQVFPLRLFLLTPIVLVACGQPTQKSSEVQMLLGEDLRSTVLPCPDGPTSCDLYDKQWNMANKLKVNPWGVPISTPGDINIETIWNEGKTGDEAIIVAVIDTGVDRRHPDLEKNIFINTREIPGNGVDDDGNGYIDDTNGWNFVGSSPNVDDPVGHGTHIAGIIGARRDNGFGIRGINNKVRILPVVYLDSKTHGNMQNAVDAIHYAVDMGAKIINASWGGGQWDELREAIQWAESKGVLCILSSGNDGENLDIYPYYPASFQLPNTIVVGSSSFDDAVTGDSNWGRRSVDIIAPGIEILSTLPGGQYGYMSGTSMAAPHVAGAAALLWSEHPLWTYKDVKKTLLLSSKLRSDYFNRVREGRLDLTAAMHEILRPEASIDELWQNQADGRSVSYAKAGIYRLTLDVPGAKFLRVRLKPLTLTAGKQRVIIEDARGNSLQRFSSPEEDVVSEYVVGQQLVLKFIVDKDGDPLQAVVESIDFVK